MEQKLDGRLDPRALRALAARSDLAGWLQWFGHLAALGLIGTLVMAAVGTVWLLPAMALHGIVLVFLFAPLHETIHRTAFLGRCANDVVAFLAGLPLVLPPAWFRAFHFAHHRFTQDPSGIRSWRRRSRHRWRTGSCTSPACRIGRNAW